MGPRPCAVFVYPFCCLCAWLAVLGSQRQDNSGAMVVSLRCSHRFLTLDVSRSPSTSSWMCPSTRQDYLPSIREGCNENVPDDALMSLHMYVLCIYVLAQIAQLADGFVVARKGGTVVMVSAVSNRNEMDESGFLPLSVEYREKVRNRFYRKALRYL